MAKEGANAEEGVGKPPDLKPVIVQSVQEPAPATRQLSELSPTAEKPKQAEGSIEFTPFQLDVTEYLLSTKIFTGSWGNFLELFPQYRTYSFDEIKRNIPHYVEIHQSGLRHDGLKDEIEIPERIYYPFIYRGEGSGYDGGLTDLVDLLDVYKNQGGIMFTGRTSRSDDHRAVSIFAQHPALAESYARNSNARDSKTGGLWIVRTDVIREIDKTAWYTTDEHEIRSRQAIPLRYVERLLVTKEVRDKILAKYGPDDIELFGKPLKDIVIVGFDESDRNLARRIILELSLQSPTRLISPSLEVYLRRKLENHSSDFSVLGTSRKIIEAQGRSMDGNPIIYFVVDLLNAGITDTAVVDVIDNGMSASEASLGAVFEFMKPEENIFSESDILSRRLEKATEIGRAVWNTVNILETKVSREDIIYLFKHSDSFKDFVELGNLNNIRLAALLFHKKVLDFWERLRGKRGV